MKLTSYILVALSWSCMAWADEGVNRGNFDCDGHLARSASEAEVISYLSQYVPLTDNGLYDGKRRYRFGGDKSVISVTFSKKNNRYLLERIWFQSHWAFSHPIEKDIKDANGFLDKSKTFKLVKGRGGSLVAVVDTYEKCKLKFYLRAWPKNESERALAYNPEFKSPTMDRYTEMISGPNMPSSTDDKRLNDIVFSISTREFFYNNR